MARNAVNLSTIKPMASKVQLWRETSVGCSKKFSSPKDSTIRCQSREFSNFAVYALQMTKLQSLSTKVQRQPISMPATQTGSSLSPKRQFKSKNSLERVPQSRIQPPSKFRIRRHWALLKKYFVYCLNSMKNWQNLSRNGLRRKLKWTKKLNSLDKVACGWQAKMEK